MGPPERQAARGVRFRVFARDPPRSSRYHVSIAIDSPRQRAASYQLVTAQTVAASRAEVISRVVDLTRYKTSGEGPDASQVKRHEAFLAQFATVLDQHLAEASGLGPL